MLDILTSDHKGLGTGRQRRRDHQTVTKPIACLCLHTQGLPIEFSRRHHTTPRQQNHVQIIPKIRRSHRDLEAMQRHRTKLLHDLPAVEITP